MDRHIKALGLLNIIFGVAALLIPIATLIIAGGFEGLFASFNEDVYAFVAVASLVFHMVLAIPCIVCGIFVRRLADWARVFLIVVSAINVLNVPVGSFLGVYGLWVLLLPETEPLFENAAVEARRKAFAHSAAAAHSTQSTSTQIVPSTTKQPLT